MLAKQRQSRILAEVRRHGGVRVSGLVELLGVSDMTVRRDLDALARQGLLDKVHGGATAVESDGSSEEPGFAAKSGREPAEKQAIAVAAAGLVGAGTAVALSAGTTTWALARCLTEVEGLTVVTNSPHVAEVFHQEPRADRTVVMTGGLRTPSDALVGPLAVAALNTLHVDVVFLGVHGMDLDAGFTTPNLTEAETNRALLRAARRVVVVADHTKWGTVGLSSIGRLEDADVLVTDWGLSTAARRQLADRVGELVVAERGALAGTG